MTIRHVLTFLLLGAPALAIAGPPGHIDLTAYFASPAAEGADRARLSADIAALAAPEAGTPGLLLAYLRAAESLSARTQRHLAYLHLRSALDIDDHANAEAYSAARTDAGALMDKVRDTLRKVGKQDFLAATEQRPELARYGYLLERAERGLSHELPDGEQRVLDEMSDQAGSALWNVYQKTRRSTTYPVIHTTHGDLDANKDADALAADPDRDVRRRAWLARQTANAERAETYASLLIGVVRVNSSAAKLQHFANGPEGAYFARQFERADVDATAKAVEARAPVLMDYQRLRAAHAGHIAGVSDVHSWDMKLPSPGFTVPTFDYERARAIVPAALAPIGKAYVSHFRALLDPTMQRTDLAETQGNRVNDNFSIDAPGVPAGLFLGHWKPDAASVSVVAHEGGHAMQSQLMNEAGVSPFFNHGPGWMNEGIAILNEMLFYEYLYTHASDARTRAFYLEAQLDEMTFEIFTSAEEAQLEEGIYDGVVAGTIRNAADLDDFTVATTRRFEIWPDIDPELKQAWIGKRLMYEDPLYLANYLDAGLLATKMFAMATNDPADFQKRYAALMSRGFDAAPKEILRRFFGRDLTPRELVDDDMALLTRKTAALKTIYATLDKQVLASPGTLTPVAASAGR